MNKPLISIITVVRNAAPELELTLQSLTGLDTAVADIELIVIDGASSDSTPQVIRAFEPRLSYWVSEPDAGLYDAMNKGIRAARGEYLWFVNAGDTVYSPDILTRIFGTADEWADVYYGQAMIVQAQTQRELGLRRKRLPATLDWKSLRRGMVVCHQSFLVRRSIAPLYDTPRYRLAADIAWVIECLKRARTIRNTGLILSRFSAGGLSSRRRLESLLERWSIMCRYYGFWPTLWAHIGFTMNTMKHLFLLSAALLLLAGCAPTEAPQETKVMTFNIRNDNPADGINQWQNRREALVQMLRAEQPDVLGIQEGLAHQVSYLDSALMDYAYVGVGRDDGKTAGEYTAIFYRTQRLELQEQGTFWLNPTQDTARMGWDAVCARIATWATFRERTTGREFRVFNTHFDHIGKLARQESAKLLAGRVEQAGDSVPAVIMGDFNCTMSDASLAPLATAFVEARGAFLESHPQQANALPLATFQGFGFKAEVSAEEAVAPIDHIFVRGFRPTQYRIITDDYGVPFLSDHYPVVATLTVL